VIIVADPQSAGESAVAACGIGWAAPSRFVDLGGETPLQMLATPARAGR
jgi:hypothetical protein